LCVAITLGVIAVGFVSFFAYCASEIDKLRNDQPVEWIDKVLGTKKYLDTFYDIAIGFAALFALELVLTLYACGSECCSELSRPFLVIHYVVWILLTLFQVPPFLFWLALLIAEFAVCGFSCYFGAYLITAIPCAITLFFVIFTATAIPSSKIIRNREEELLINKDVEEVRAV